MATAAPEWAVEISGLVRTFGDVVAVDGVDLRVSPGTVFALLGPNGAGKTTTVAVLTTLIPPTAGRCLVAGFDVRGQAAHVRRAIGVTFQEVALDDDLPGRLVLDLHARLYGMGSKERQAALDEVISLVELGDAIHRKVGTYSGGMKRRLELARGLMTRPSVLFLDEPTLGLDAQNRVRIWEYVKRCKKHQGTTVFMTTHYMEEAEQLADEVGIIDHGRLVALGSPGELIRQMGADAIRLEVSGDPDALLRDLSAEPYVQSVERAPGILFIGVDSGSQRLAAVVNKAVEAGLAIRDATVSRPSLNDVFLRHTGSELRD